MQGEFYKFTSSLNERLKCTAECFTKTQNSQRKYRKVFLSDVYLYLLSSDKIKLRISILKIKKVIASNNSAEFVVLSDAKAVLVDSLMIRAICIKEIKRINDKVEVIYVKQPLLDQYLEGNKVDTTEEGVVLNLNRLRTAFSEFGPDPFKKKFDQLYKIEECIYKDQHSTLVVVSETKLRDQFRKKKKKKLEPTKYTVRIYPKEPLAKNKQLLHNIINEKKCLEQAMSPYLPVLYKCMISKTYAYCLTEHYTGEPLEHYIANETMNKHTIKNLIAQITIALGQLHQSNLTYNKVNLKAIFVTNNGFIMLNDLSACKKIQSYSRNTIYAEKDIKEERQKQKETTLDQNDWYQLGKLIFQIKQGKEYILGNQIEDYKEKQLTNLVRGLLELDPTKRLGFKNDYYEILAHQYFKEINKKELAAQTCQPLKKFFQINHQMLNKQNLSSLLQSEDWSVHDELLKDYEYCRQLQD